MTFTPAAEALARMDHQRARVGPLDGFGAFTGPSLAEANRWRGVILDTGPQFPSTDALFAPWRSPSDQEAA